MSPRGGRGLIDELLDNLYLIVILAVGILFISAVASMTALSSGDPLYAGWTNYTSGVEITWQLALIPIGLLGFVIVYLGWIRGGR